MARKRHVKSVEFKVSLSPAEAVDLRELAKRERVERDDNDLGGATLLREYAMPRVRERLAELKAASLQGVA